MVTFLAYVKYPNSILIKNPQIDRIILIFPRYPPVSEMRSPEIRYDGMCLSNVRDLLTREKYATGHGHIFQY